MDSREFNTKESLVWTEAQLWVILESAPDATVIANTDGDIVLVNRQAEILFGYTRDELVGSPVEMLVPERFRDRHNQHRAAYTKEPRARSMDLGLGLFAHRKGGSEIPVEISLSPIRTADGTYTSAAVRDATERVETEEALRRARDELEERVAERTGDLTKQTVELEARRDELAQRSRRQQRLVEFGERVITTTLLGTVLDDVAELVADVLETELCEVMEILPSRDGLLLRSGKGWNEGLVGNAIVEVDNDSQAGFTLFSDHPVVVGDLRTDQRFRGSPLLREHDVVSGISVIIYGLELPFGILGVHTRKLRVFSEDDIAFLRSVANLVGAAVERYHAEAQLAEARRTMQQRERLADVGVIVSQVVHDLGNSIAGLSMQAQLIQRRAKQGKPIETVLAPAQHVLDQTRHLDNLVADFREFSRVQQLHIALVRIPQLLESVTSLWRPVAEEKRVSLESTCPEDVPEIQADESKLRRLLDNLIKNAIEAIEIGPGEVVVTVSQPQPEMVRISVSDTGVGIPTSLDVFRVFETTKPLGTGLGLSVCKQIANSHGGGIGFAPVSPHGTVFHVDIPVQGPEL